MKKIAYILLSVMLLPLAACENDPKMFDDTPSLWIWGDPAQGARDAVENPKADSLIYSFRLYDFETQSATLNLIVTLTGPAVDRDREFRLEVVEDKTNVAAADYTIGSTVLPAGERSVSVPVSVGRTASGLDLEKEYARLRLRVAANENFAVGAEEYSEYSLEWCDYLIEPETWSYIVYYIGAFSQERYKFIIDFTGYTEFSEFNGDYNKIAWLQGKLIKLLDEYNSDPENEGRPEGWPYMETLADGTRVPLQF